MINVVLLILCLLLVSVMSSCIKPERIDHGGYNILYKEKIHSPIRWYSRLPNGVKLFYFCDDNYELKQDWGSTADHLLCQDGQWIGKQAVCVPKQAAKVEPEVACPAPPHVPHAQPSVYDAKNSEQASSNIVIYFCEDGYKISGDKTMRCENGEWMGSLPRCDAIPRGCPLPPQITHGDYNFYNQRPEAPMSKMLSTITEGTQVYYFCHNGYKMKDKNISLMICMEGKWEGEVAVCEKRTHCDTPMDIPNGNWIFSYLPYPDFRIGSQLIYECDEGYKAIGETSIECLPSGYWSDYAPKCLPKGNDASMHNRAIFQYIQIYF